MPRPHIPYEYVDSGHRQAVAAALRAGGEDDPSVRLLSALGVSGLGQLALVELADMLDSAAADIQRAYERGYADGYRDGEVDAPLPERGAEGLAYADGDGGEL